MKSSTIHAANKDAGAGSRHALQWYDIMRVLVLVTAAVFLLSGCHKANWTAKETQDWYNRLDERWRPDGILYRGSDAHWHHFIARALGDSVFITVSKEELKLDDERPYSNASSASYGYYYVDPNRGFAKMRDY